MNEKALLTYLHEQKQLYVGFLSKLDYNVENNPCISHRHCQVATSRMFSPIDKAEHFHLSQLQKS